MAYTVEQTTTGVQGTYDQLVYVVKDTTNTGEPNYRYLCSIEIDGAEVIKLKQLPNNADCAVFDIRTITRAYVSQDENPWSLGADDPTEVFSSNTRAIKEVTVTFGYEYSVTAVTLPAETMLPATAQTVRVVNGSFYRVGDRYPLAASASDQYKINGAGRLFLSDAPASSNHTIPVADENGIRSRGVLAFLNGLDVGSQGAKFLHITYYNGSTVLTTSVLQNTSSTGGADPAAPGLSEAYSLLYVAIAPYNLEAQNYNSAVKPSNNAGYTRYTAQFASSNILSGNETSAVYTFVRNGCCKYYDDEGAYTLHWWNSKGGVDSLPCSGMSVESQQFTRNTYNVIGGNAFNADGGTTPYVQESYDGGKRTTRVETTTTLQLSVQGGGGRIYTPLIKSLMNAERVFISGSGTFGLSVDRLDDGVMECVVTDASKDYIKDVNQQVESYSLTVEISRRRPNL